MAIATAVTGLASGASQFFQGQSMKNKAQAAIDKFKFDKLQNPYSSLRVSTLGAEQQLQQASQQGVASLEALQASGTRGVLGGLPQLTQQQQGLNQRITADLDRQQTNINQQAAQQDVRNQELIRQGQSQELAGYGNQLNVGMGMQHGGLNTLVNTAGFVGQTEFGKNADSFIGDLFKKKQP